MIVRPLVLLCLLCAGGVLRAQFFLGVGSEPRSQARAAWIGLSGAQNVTIDYGQPVWRREHEAFLQQESTGPMLLGKGALTSLQTDVELTFGELRVPRGRWYLAAHRSEPQRWELALFSAERVDASGLGASAILGGEPDRRIPVRVDRVAETAERFEITFTDSKRTPTGLVLAMAWGPYRLRTEFDAAFDRRSPAGAPAFARTAAGRGTTTASGLQIETLVAGAGEPPGPRDLVRVHYSGWLADGTLFDSTHLRGGPEALEMAWVVDGFAEGLQHMAPGATVRLTIPPHLGYGREHARSRVPPDSTLVFTVTLVGVERR